MTTRSTTSPAPVMPGYDPPTQQAQRDRMAAQWRKLPAVDQNGFPIAKGPAPTVVETVTPAAAPSMASALIEASEACSADLDQLLDSNRFRAAVAVVSPSDQAELQAIVRDFMPVPAAPSMKVNPSQGHVAGPVPSPGSGATLAGQMRKNTAKLLDQPEPPGSTFNR